MTCQDIIYRLTQAVIDMDATRAAAAAAAVIQHNVDPYEAIIEGLAKGMDKVNELFENEEYFVPEILLCADAMYAGIEVLRPYLTKETAWNKKKVVIGVVKGDTHDIGKNLIDSYVKAGGVPVTVEPVATGSMISERHFREFVLPYLKEVYAHIHSYNLPGVLHICGKTKRIIQCMAESGADILSIDNIDLLEAKELVGGKVCLMGNVSPADGMLKGNPEITTDMVKECVAKASDNPKGFVLATGCEVPIHTPHENMVAFLEAGRRYARLPINLN